MKVKAGRDAIGYLIGFVLFVVLVPAIMRFVSKPSEFSTARTAIFIVLAAIGLGFSVWSIVYMRNVGKGNPMDAFNHEVAPRTSELMTEGPYAICRNPMLLGVLVYYLGFVILLWSPGAAIVFVIYALIMSFQVSSEEKRLEKDFGEEYARYKLKTKRIIPFIW
ncbi:MAG: isoprenylcysteine carboxylmethyltransferase family protein [Coriobacteriales bacterium]|nr:isoprenylcysteine carboxylmethyltransferase family protein [Coriobacteriales bacterium]